MSGDVGANVSNVSSKSASIHEVSDFDWKVKVVLASSSAGMMYEPLTSVNFKTTEGKDVTLELNKQQLDEMITAMDAAVTAASELER